MADSSCFSVKVLDQCMVCPPPGSVPATLLPLTFFDLMCLRYAPTRRLFFYQFPHSTAHFTHAILPSLKRSLSLSLQHFFPFAANLILPPHTHKPHFLYTPHDSVQLAIAESDPSHFHALVPDHPKDAKDVYPLFQDWPMSRLLSDGTQVIPLMALQITIFPYHGLSLCVSFLHVAADGPSVHHFIRSWASISAGNGLNGPLPSHDRTVVQDPEGLESAFLRHHWSVAEPILLDSEPISQRLSDKVRATFSLSKPQIERLKNWANSQITKSTQFSSFVVTCSVVWVSFIMSRELISGGSGAEDEACCFAFTANCRNERLGYRIPAEYFGNCFAFCLTTVEKSELLGENGLVVAMKAIEKRVGEVKKETLKDAMAETTVWKEFVERGTMLCAVGSPRLGAYDTNFGWGRPIKTEVVQVDRGRLFSIGESRNENGGIEVGLGLGSAHMASFVAVWEQNLKLIGCS